MLRYFKVAKWRANRQLKQHNANFKPHKARLIKRIQSIWFNLSTAQKLYLLALISLLLLQSAALASLLTIIALIVEFWPKFIQLWHSLAGKALILLFYAIIANFVLANASGIVNEVTQVSAAHFNYSHNFATLLYLPPWALGITLGTLLLLQLILPFYIIALLVIKPFGSDRVKFISQSYSPLLTALLRFSLASVVIVNLISFIDEKPTEQVFDEIVSSFSNGAETGQALAAESSGENEQALKELNEQLKPIVNNSQESLSDEPSKIAVDVEGDGGTAENMTHFLETKGYFERSKWLIASFAYHFEADTFSRCAKAKNSKTVELNDYEFVEITLDNTEPYSYSFIVKACDSPGIKPVK
ncbi:hypothetical protein [Pseudoalteromonas sp. ZZD1]|uniref:hypothetical protein n=1 Tax=Pseudoalteromonas sp. ZZD1 TaxID=3139395 RepID=UPI003BABE813